MIPVALYPLRWPAGRDHLAPGRRRRAKFRLTFDAAYNVVIDELARVGAFNAQISSNVPLSRQRSDDVYLYLPISSAARRVEDPGAAVHFERTVGQYGAARGYVIACDSYTTVAANLRAIAVTLRAMREIVRHGAGEIVEQALDGFRALPAPALVEGEVAA